MDGKKLYISDVTLCDSMHTIRHQCSLENARRIAKVLNGTRADPIEMAHGDGLQGSSFSYGFGAHSDLERVKVAADAVKHAKAATLLLPGIGAIHNLKDVWQAGARVARVVAHYIEADVSAQHIQYAHEPGMDIVSFLMMGHMVMPEDFVKQIKLMEGHSAICIYVVDFGGAMSMGDIRDRLRALKAELKPEMQAGMHARHNLSLGVANSIVVVEGDCDRIDAGLVRMGTGAGNTPLEVFIVAADKLGWQYGTDPYALMGAADDLVCPLQDRPVRADRETPAPEYADVYSSFLYYCETAATRYGLSAVDILAELGRRRVAGGQEDIIVGVVLDPRNNKQ